MPVRWRQVNRGLVCCSSYQYIEPVTASGAVGRARIQAFRRVTSARRPTAAGMRLFAGNRLGAGAAGAGPPRAHASPHRSCGRPAHIHPQKRQKKASDIQGILRRELRAFRATQQPRRRLSVSWPSQQQRGWCNEQLQLCRYPSEAAPAVPSQREPFDTSGGVDALEPAHDLEAVPALEGRGSGGADAVSGDTEGGLLSQPEDVREVLRRMRRACCGEIPEGQELVQRGRGSYLGMDVSWNIAQQASGAFTEVGPVVILRGPTAQICHHGVYCQVGFRMIARSTVL